MRSQVVTYTQEILILTYMLVMIASEFWCTWIPIPQKMHTVYLYNSKILYASFYPWFCIFVGGYTTYIGVELFFSTSIVIGSDWYSVKPVQWRFDAKKLADITKSMTIRFIISTKTVYMYLWVLLDIVYCDIFWS